MPLAGDYNANGVVDTANYVVRRKTGINGQQGYNDWRANFGETAGSGSVSITTVPEAATLILLTLGLLGSISGEGWSNRECRKLVSV